MVKTKKVPKLLKELQDIVLNKKNLINVPEINKKLNKKLNKKIEYNSNIDFIEHECKNIIPNNNSLKSEFIIPTKDNMYKTHIYTLQPTEEQKKILLNYCDGYLEMYNLTVKKIKNERKKQSELTNKHNIRYCDMTYEPDLTILKKNFSKEKDSLNKKYNINKHILDYAIKDCISMFKSIVTNQKNKSKLNSKMRYLKKSKNKKIFKIEKQICKEKSFCVSVLGSELKIKPELNYKNEYDTVHTIQYNKKDNKFYLLKKNKIEQSIKESKNNSISIDPGMRTIITGVSENHTLEIGTKVGEKIKNKLEKIEILKNKEMNNNNKKKKINKIKKSIENYVKDVHWKISNYLIENYDNIMIGSFSTSSMKRENKGINLEVMKSLNMYNLRERIKYKCLKHKKRYLKVNEAYTTKVCINCSEVNEIGCNKIYECKKCKKIYDRDIKSAGCIYLKALK